MRQFNMKKMDENMIRDVAVAAGISFERMSANIEKVYNSLQNNQSPDYTNLQQLGVLSGSARKSLEDFGYISNSSIDTWEAFKTELELFKGMRHYEYR